MLDSLLHCREFLRPATPFQSDLAGVDFHFLCPLFFNCMGLLDAFVADLWVTLVIFGSSRAFGNSSFYDSFWSLAPPLFLGYWWFTRALEADETRLLLLTAVVGFWAIRLTLNWAFHWDGLHEEDWRYAMLRDKAPKFAFFTDLLLIHFLPPDRCSWGSCLSTRRLRSRPILWV